MPYDRVVASHFTADTVAEGVVDEEVAVGVVIRVERHAEQALLAAAGHARPR